MVGNRPVGIFARNRQCYGRNLPSEFYKELIILLEDMGYTPIWLGEKASTLECPVDHIVDFSRMEESRDLELTLAIVSLCEFTTQFWTASTRLAAMIGVPYLLFESPDQLWGAGQEGKRLSLVTMGKKKIVATHYLNVLNNQRDGIDLVKRAIVEMQENNYNDIIAMVDDVKIVQKQRSNFIGW